MSAEAVEGQGTAPDTRDAALRARLAALGVHAAVADDGALAVVRLLDWPAQGVAPLRRPMADAARAVGFTHVALEITDELLADGRATADADAGDAPCDSSSR